MKLETKRLILRKPRLSDWKDVVEGRKNLDVIKNFVYSVHPYKKKNAEKWIKYDLKSWNKKTKQEILLLLN